MSVNAAKDLLAAADALERRAADLRAEAARLADAGAKRNLRALKAKVLTVAGEVLAAVDDPAAPEALANAAHRAHGAILWAAPLETVAAWIAAERGRNSRLARILRDRAVMRRYRQGRRNAEIAAEFGLSLAQAARIIAAGKALT